MKLAKQSVSAPKTVRWLKWLLIALIAAYPLAGAFFGLDLGDTGYHLYAYTNLASHPDKLNYTTFLSSVVGFLWGRLFDGLGLIAYNLLEVFLEWGAVFIIYRTLRKDLGELTVLAGGLFAVVCADAYLNIFNYHQFHAFLLTAILCLEYRAVTDDKKLMSLWAGVLYALLVFARVGSAVALVTLGLYIYHAAVHGFSWKDTGKHLLCFAGGAAAAVLAAVLCLLATGRMEFFVANIFRLGDIASDSSTSYGFVNLLTTLVKDNLNVIASGLLFYAAAALFACGVNIALQRDSSPLRRTALVLVGCFTALIALYQMRFAFDINPAEPWPQMTTGQKFLLGVLYVTAFLCFLRHAFRKDLHSQKISLLVIASCMLIVLAIAGSNTGTKHIILAMWLMAPVCIYAVRELAASGCVQKLAVGVARHTGMEWRPWSLRAAVIVALALFFLKCGHMVYYTFNYDCVDRTKLTATVDSPKVRGILTTRREADALNGVLEKLSEFDEEQPLMVFGNTLLLYYMTGREAYGMPWVTQGSYPLERYQEDLAKAGEEYKDVLPLVVYCRTDYSLGFDEELLGQNQWNVTANAYSGKKQCFLDFLESHEYGIDYMNDYYAVIVPNLTTDMKGLENVVFGW